MIQNTTSSSCTIIMSDIDTMSNKTTSDDTSSDNDTTTVDAETPPAGIRGAAIVAAEHPFPQYWYD